MDRTLLQGLFEKYNAGLLPRGLDALRVRQHVPHRAPATRGGKSESLNLAVGHVPNGNAIPASESVGLLQAAASMGHWKAALKLSAALQVQRGGHVSTSDVSSTLVALLNAKQHAQLLAFFFRHRDVELDPLLYSRLLGAFRHDPRATKRIVNVLETTRGPGGFARESRLRGSEQHFDYDLHRTVLRSLAAHDWQRALDVYQRSPTYPVPTAGGDAVGYLAAKLLSAPDASMQTAGLALVNDVAIRLPGELPCLLLESLSSLDALHTIARNESTRRILLNAAGGAHATMSCEPIHAQWALALGVWSHVPNLGVAAAACVATVLAVAPERQNSLHQVVAHADDVNSLRISRTVCHHRATKLAVAMLCHGLEKKRFSSVPILASCVAVAGMWSTALSAMSELLAARRSPPTVHELSLCVSAACRSGRWAQALFWLERGHGRGQRFSSHVYDTVFAAQVNSSRAKNRLLRAVSSMHAMGGRCGEAGNQSLRRHGVGVDIEL